MPSTTLQTEVRHIAVVSNIRRVGCKKFGSLPSFEMRSMCSISSSAKTANQFTIPEHGIDSNVRSLNSRNLDSISARICAFCSGESAAMLRNKAAPNCSTVPFIFAFPGIAELLCGSNR
jgi:hypothetical protein